jgi:excisionase family DNA binding protein
MTPLARTVEPTWTYPAHLEKPRYGGVSLFGSRRTDSRGVTPGATAPEPGTNTLGFNWYQMHTFDHQNEGLLTIPEVASRLSVSTSTVRRLVSKGEIPAVRLGSSPASSIRIDPAELNNWLYQQENA